MTDLDRLERQMLDAVRSELRPTQADRARVGELLGARLGVSGLALAATSLANAVPSASVPTGSGVSATGGGAPGPLVVSPTTAQLSAGTGVSVLKLVLTACLVAGLGAVAAVVGWPEAERPPAVVTGQQRAEPEKAVAPQVADSIALEAEPDAVLRRAGTVSDVQPAPEKPAKARRAASAPASSDLEAELRLLRQAHRANAQNRPGVALRIVEQVRKKFPQGRLTEERQAVRVIATCKAGPGPGAAAQARRFLKGYPHSVYGGRVRSACLSLTSDR